MKKRKLENYCEYPQDTFFYHYLKKKHRIKKPMCSQVQHHGERTSVAQVQHHGQSQGT